MTDVTKGLGTRGKAFYEAVTGDLLLEAHEGQLLLEVCRTLDRLDALNTIISRQGYLMADGKANPALVECRLQSVTLARLVASLRLPDEYRAEVLDRGQRRGSARGVYKLKAVPGA